MAGDRGKIKIRYTLIPEPGAEAFSQKTGQTFLMSGWKAYIILALSSFAAVILSILFFSLLLPLILGFGLLAAVWVWWIRRKLRNTLHANHAYSHYVVIDETHNVDSESAEKGED